MIYGFQHFQVIFKARRALHSGVFWAHLWQSFNLKLWQVFLTFRENVANVEN